MNYDINYFIDKFESIPEKLWTTGTALDTEGRKCSLGHCEQFDYLDEVDKYNDEAKALHDLCQIEGTSPWQINDGRHDYEGDTAKQRMLTFLKKLRKELYE